MNPPTARCIKWTEKLGYAVGDTASCLYWQTFSMFLMIFYTDTFGISAAAVATMFLITRVWDSAIDPVMGIIADRTQSRFGRFRPWLLWGIAPFTISGVLMFITPEVGSTGKLVYAYITYSLVMLAYTMVNVPYGALLGVISPNSADRTELASYRFVGAFVGNIIVQGCLLRFVHLFGQGNDRLGYPLAFGVFAIAAGALFYMTFAFTRERIQPPLQQTSIRRDLGDLLHNSPWIVLCLLGLGTLIYISVRNGATLYYFKYYLKDEGAAAGYLVTGTLASIVGSLLPPYITRMLGSKKAALIFLTLLCAAILAVFYFVTPQTRFALYALNICLGAPNAALFPLIWSMYADTADYGEWKTGRRATGLVFSAATFAQKMGWAVGGSFAGYILAAIGFVANVEQTTTAQQGIRHMMSTLPAAIAALVALGAIFYRLNRKLETQIAQDLASRRQTAQSS